MAGRVLYIEDEKFLGKTLKHTLEKEGFQVVLAEDGDTGLTQAQTGVYNLILLDILLPKMNGFEILERLNKDGILKTLPVVVLSNLDNSEDQKRAKELGATAYFVKALIDPKTLIKNIQAILSNKHT